MPAEEGAAPPAEEGAAPPAEEGAAPPTTAFVFPKTGQVVIAVYMVVALTGLANMARIRSIAFVFEALSYEVRVDMLRRLVDGGTITNGRITENTERMWQNAD